MYMRINKIKMATFKKNINSTSYRPDGLLIHVLTIILCTFRLDGRKLDTAIAIIYKTNEKNRLYFFFFFFIKIIIIVNIS